MTNVKFVCLFFFQKKTQKADLYSSIFGELSDDDDDFVNDNRVYQILESMKIPKMLSPIKDLPEDLRSISPPQMQLISPPEMQLNVDENVITTIDSIQLSNLQPGISSPCHNLESIEDVINNVEIADCVEHTTDVGNVNLQLPNLNQFEIEEMPSQVTSENIGAEDNPDDQIMNENQVNDLPDESNKVIASDEKEQFPNDSDKNISEICEIDFDSPASPKPDDQVSMEDAPVIPINTLTDRSQCNDNVNINDQNQATTDSALDHLIYNYVQNTRDKIQTSNTKFSGAECYLIASLRNAIEKHCLQNEWTSTTSTETIEKLLSLGRQPKHLAIAILEVVEDTKETLSLAFTPLAPAMQPSHQKCLLIVSKLSQLIPSFDQYLQYELERKLFTFQPQEKSVVAMTNLAQFYVGLIDIEQPNDRSKVRLFIFKCLYYFKNTAIPLIFTVIMAHPLAIPHAKTIEHIMDPLTRAIVSALSNIVYTESTGREHYLYKKLDMFTTLKRRYGFFMDKLFPTDSIVDYCVECIRSNHLQHVDYALILIAKRQDRDYAVTKILDKHLIPMLHQYVSMNLMANTEHDDKICMILFTIGSIVKTFPIEHNITGFLHIFVTCLNATHRQCIQEAAISAICQMSRFGMAQIYPHLASWRPNYTISSYIQTMLKTYVYRKPKQFWFTKRI